MRRYIIISEVDLRDWDRVDFKKIEEVLEDGTYIQERAYFWDFLNQVKELHQKQLRKIPKLERE